MVLSAIGRAIKLMPTPAVTAIIGTYMVQIYSTHSSKDNYVTKDTAPPEIPPSRTIVYTDNVPKPPPEVTAIIGTYMVQIYPTIRPVEKQVQRAHGFSIATAVETIATITEIPNTIDIVMLALTLVLP